MSDAYIKKYTPNHSAEKRKPAPDLHTPKGRNKRPRPFVIECLWINPWTTGEPQWRTEGRYRTEAEREQALKAKLHKEALFLERFPNRRCYMKFRIKPDAS